MNQTPVVSVVIVTFNGLDCVRGCLASIYRHMHNVATEVIVVDNASADGTPDMIAAEFPQVRLIRRRTNSGFSGGVNEGIGCAHGRVYFILNPDTEIGGDVLSPMLMYLERHPDVGLLGPKLLNTDGTVQLSCRAFPDFGAALFGRNALLTRLFSGSQASSRFLMKDFARDTIRDVDWLSGAAWLLPRPTVDAVGMLDEAYFWSVEDVDYCQRVHRAGLRVVFFPDTSLLHRIGGSSASAPALAIIARHRGLWRYYRKYMRPADVFTQIILDGTVAVGVLMRCGAHLIACAMRSRG